MDESKDDETNHTPSVVENQIHSGPITTTGLENEINANQMNETPSVSIITNNEDVHNSTSNIDSIENQR